MNLWIFGDSFAHLHYWPERDAFNNSGQWQNQLRELTDTTLKSHALSGSSLDYVYYKFNQVRKEIRPRDIVIVFLTDFNRRWFWPDRPQDSSPYAIELNKIEATAYKYYEAYLNNREIYKTYLLTFLNDLQGWTQFKHLQTIVIPCFPDVEEFVTPHKRDLFLIHIAEGNLIDVSRNEFTSDIRDNPHKFDHFCRNDLRLNHLTKSNHTILANKLYDHIMDGMANPVNLREGFVEGIITPSTIKNEDFVKLELFNAHNTETWNKH